MWQRLSNFIKKHFYNIVEKASAGTNGALLVVGKLFGINVGDGGDIKATGLITAAWIFFLGIPFGLIVFGPQFSVLIWMVAVATTLAVVHLDEALLLMSTLLEPLQREEVNVST